MVLYENRSECCGCGACLAKCPRHAIIMQEDENGFLYPAIDENMCIGCGICREVCGYRNSSRYHSLRKTYAAVAEDVDLSASSSGAIFPSIAEAFLEKGGLVCGCKMIFEEGQVYVRHELADQVKDVREMRGSKYVQSDMTTVFSLIEDNLKNDRKVLFCGTPCQVAGLRGFLQKTYDKLFCIDFICHGVPNLSFLRSYIRFFENKHHIQVQDFCFRDKSQGWKLFGRIKGKDLRNEENIFYFEPEMCSYYQIFLNGYSYRDNCYSCPFASDNRPGDLTLGDYWCLDLVHPEYLKEWGGELDQKLGVSCLIINNEHGNELMEKYGDKIKRWNSSFEQAAKYNRQLLFPVALRKEREKILKRYRIQGYNAVDSWYNRRLSMVHAKRRFKALIPVACKKWIRRFIK